MSHEIRELRARWQNYRQVLMRAEYNQADEELARALYFANTKPIIADVVSGLRKLEAYDSFDASAWLEDRPIASTMGSGQTNTRLSLDDTDRAAQCLKILEFSNQKADQGDDGLLTLGFTTHGSPGGRTIDTIRSAIQTIFEPFYQYIDGELRIRESLITPLDIIKDIQSLIDTQASTYYPETHRLLQDTYRQLFSLKAGSSGPSWNQVGYACRHVLIRFADEVFKPEFVAEGNPQPKGDDARSKLKWAARYYLRTTGAGTQYRDSLEAIVEANWSFVGAIGHRQESATEEDARLAVIYTYLTIKIINQVANGRAPENTD